MQSWYRVEVLLLLLQNRKNVIYVHLFQFQYTKSFSLSCHGTVLIIEAQTTRESKYQQGYKGTFLLNFEFMLDHAFAPFKI